MEKGIAAKKILFLVGDFAEDYEVMVPFQADGARTHRPCRVPRQKGGTPDQERDGNLVTGFAWSAHPPFLALFLEALGTHISL
jgi:hypothetical protein